MPELFEGNPRIVLETSETEQKSSAERVLSRITWLTQSKSKLAREDGHLYRSLVGGNEPGFEGLYFFKEIPSANSDVTTEQKTDVALETVTAEPLGQTAWIILADTKQLAKLSDTQLIIALIEESFHARDRINTIKKDHKLHRMTPQENEQSEIMAMWHTVEVYRELANYGFYDETLDYFSKFLAFRETKLKLEEKGKEEIIADRNEEIKKFLIMKGYSF